MTFAIIGPESWDKFQLSQPQLVILTHHGVNEDSPLDR